MHQFKLGQIIVYKATNSRYAVITEIGRDSLIGSTMLKGTFRDSKEDAIKAYRDFKRGVETRRTRLYTGELDTREIEIIGNINCSQGRALCVDTQQSDYSVPKTLSTLDVQSEPQYVSKPYS